MPASIMTDTFIKRGGMLSAAFTIFIAAFLSFSIQPLVGRTISPLLGGSPQSWLVCLAFFQSALLAGYGLVHVLARFKATAGGIAILLLMVLGGFFLPAYPPLHAALQAASHAPTPLGLYAILWAIVGLPVVALGTVAPLIQRLVNQQGHANPYQLYMLSNLGSLLGLLSYPFVVERLYGLQQQSAIWFSGYAFVLLGLGLCLTFTLRLYTTTEPVQTAAPAPIARKYFWLWVLLAALSSSLLSGTTSLITTDIGALPLVWVIPLALYLLSFILAFRRDYNTKTDQILRSAQLFGAFIIFAFLFAPALDLKSWIGPSERLLSVLTIMALTSYCVHRFLYSVRPDPAHLSLFYLAIALGGALGGSFNAFLVPLIFKTPNEFYIVLLLCTMAVPTLMQNSQDAYRRLRLALIALAVTVALMVAYFVIKPTADQLIIVGQVAIILGVAATALNRMTFTIACFMGLLLIQPLTNNFGGTVVYQARNYFGLWRVIDINSGLQRILQHGTTLHGLQPNLPQFAKTPVSYYGAKGPLGDIMALVPTGAVAAVGLGTGQIGCYQTESRRVTFYDIDPDIVEISKNLFNYQMNCGPHTIVMGDGRLSLSRTDNTYDLILLDAFSSDSIPTHLMTVEAMQAYAAHLSPKGMILFHTSNRFFDLVPPLTASAMKANFIPLRRFDIPDATRPFDNKSEWVVLVRDEAQAKTLLGQNWQIPDTSARPWTDDFTPLIDALH